MIEQRWRRIARRHRPQPPSTMRALLEIKITLGVDMDPDDDGVHQVRIEPFGIATFGTSVADAYVQAEDAMRSYLESFETFPQMIAAFDKHNVEYRHVTEISPVSTAVIAFPEQPADLMHATQDSIPSLPSSRHVHGVARTPCPA